MRINSKFYAINTYDKQIRHNNEVKELHLQN